MKNTERNNRTTTCDSIKTYSKLFNIKYADTKHMSEYLMHSHVDDRKIKNNKLMAAMEIAHTHTHTHSFKHLPIHTFSHTPHTHRTEVLISVLWSPSKSRKQRNYTRFCKYTTLPLAVCLSLSLATSFLFLLYCVFEAFVQCGPHFALPRANHIVNR